MLVLLIGIFVLGYLAIFIPMLAVQVRRFHDQDLSGWFILLGFIPYLGGLIMLVFMCIDGTPGPNRFGPDPKGRGEGYSDVFRLSAGLDPGIPPLDYGSEMIDAPGRRVRDGPNGGVQ